MAIKIVRNTAGNCITFRGTTNPTHFNACLSGEVDAVDATLVNVVNDIQTADTGTTKYEFFNIPFTDLLDADGVGFADAQAAADYITLNGNVSAPEDIRVGYRGVYDASLAVTPDVTDVNYTPENGDWYYINTEGTIDGLLYRVNDIIRYNDVVPGWDRILSSAATVEELESSALNRYDIHVDGDYTGTIRNGSSVHPYNDLAIAIAASTEGQSILIKGTITVPVGQAVGFQLPHGLKFYGADECVVKFAIYNSTNGDLFRFDGVDNTQEFLFDNITLANAGGYGLYIKKTARTHIRDCKIKNNGWSGNGLNTVLASTSTGMLGYDSAQASLQAFWAGTETSNGGAMRIEEATMVTIANNEVSKNLRGIRVQDCGIGGGGFITRNTVIQNIESGIYLAAGTLAGCHNVVVAINSSAYNSNNGLLVIGGINNKFSQNEVNGNWNAGFCAWGSANATLRDCGLYDNNRSAYNGIGNVGDAKASIQINEAYDFLGTQISLNPAFRFIAEILDTQVHYTGFGSNTDKIGFLITSDVGDLPDNSKNIIKIDDVGFIGQDYAIDLSEVNVENLRLSLGDNSFQSITYKAVKPPAAGNYNELPFSNHVMEVPEVDVLVDTLKHMITLTEGVGGNTINTYQANELVSVIHNGYIDIIQANTDKIQLRDLSFGNIYVNGVLAGNEINSANDTLNAAFNMDLVEYKEFLVSEVGINGDETSGGSLPAVANNWYVSYGAQSGTQITTATIGNDFRNHNPFYNGEALEKGHEFVWTHNPSYGYVIGLWGAAQAPQAGNDAITASNWSQGFAFNGSTIRFSQTDSSGVTIQQNGSTSGNYNMPNGQLAIRFGQDNYLYLYEIVDGGYSLIGKSNTTIAGTSVMIQWASFNEGSFPVMTERTETWEIVHDFDSSQNGEWSNGLEESTIIKSRISVSPGEKITLNLSYFGRSEKIGFGYPGASTGVTAAEDTIVDGFFYNTSEVIKEMGAAESNWTWNTSAINSYDPNGDRSDIGYDGRLNTSSTLGLISFRYMSDNSLELWHETNNELIATKKVDLDGSDFNIYLGANESAHTVDRIPALAKYDMSAEDEGASLTGWYYIESPDGSFYYPLFATESEANYIDATEGGGGSSHTHTFADDLSGSTWYMPNTNGTHAGASAPQGGVWGNSINVIWNEIATGDDANYLPTFNNITYNVQEGSAINIQYKAAGMTDTFNLTNVPAGYADNGNAIIGTAEDITNGYGQSVTHTINVTKANNFGSVQGTITINVLANLSGNEFTIVDQGGAIKFTQDGGITVLDFNTATFNAGSTYKFYVDGSTMQSNDVFDIVDANGAGITGNDGLTMSGGSGPGYAGTYFQYAIPTDVPPGKFITFTDGATNTSYPNVPLTIAGSTYIANPTGVALEGPSANQTGSNVMDENDHGWISLNETLAAGERLVLDNAFFDDFLSEVKGTNTIFAIGLKGENWTNTKEVNSNGAAASGLTFKGNTYIVGVWNSGGNTVTMWLCANGILGNSMYMNTQSLWPTACAFLEITNSGNNIRAGFGRNGNLGITAGSESTTTYGNWNSYKGQTGEQGFGISDIDVVMSFWTFDGDAIDGNEIDWTGLTEVSVPVAPTRLTSWTKAVDFSGSNEHLKQVNSTQYVNAIRMGAYSATVPNNSDSTKTADDGYSLPWATAIVFKADGNNSNQHIWNQGEGTGSNDDNIALRLSASKNLYLYWGRSGSENECEIASNISNTQWYGVYICHKGARFSASNATASNLADAFDIRVMTSADSFGSVSPDISSNWNSTGGRMDRTVTGDFTIGGRGSNRNFHGQVASMVITTLKRNDTVPTDAEIELMITDPVKWVTDYKVGNSYRYPNTTSNYPNFQVGDTQPAQSTQVWLMGDNGNTIDNFNNGLRNYVQTSDQNWTKVQFNSMQSNDIQNVSISGLS